MSNHNAAKLRMSHSNPRTTTKLSSLLPGDVANLFNFRIDDVETAAQAASSTTMHTRLRIMRLVQTVEQRIREVTRQNRCHPVLPFCHFRIHVPADRFKAFIIRKMGVADAPATLGGHLRRRRLTLRLRQENAARQLGVLREVYERWERDERVPVVSAWPAILQFLDCYPFPQESPADWILMIRRRLGVEQKVLAARVGVAHQRLRGWEHGNELPDPEACSRLRLLLPESLQPEMDWRANSKDAPGGEV